MAQVAYLLLCHKDVPAIVAQAERLTAMGDAVAIHFDARASTADYRRLTRALAGVPNVIFAAQRHRCGWGEWSLVAGTLAALRAAVAAFPRASHFYLISGDCMPIKSAEYTRAYLSGDDADLIESEDFFTSGWIKTGLREERLTYRHWFNERSQHRRFYSALWLQRRLGLRRRPPADLEIRIGSQWWCLRRATVEALLSFIERRRDVVRFFRTTWIPDETFFQTLVRHLVAEPEIRSRTPTFLLFSDYGMPVTFYNDHYGLLLAQDALFARKISPEAQKLKARLGALYAEAGRAFPISGEGQRLYDFLTRRGRIGERFAPRFWEADATIGRERTLYILACKKWHVAKRLLARIGAVSNLPALEYLFDEEDTPLPDLGGIQTALAKRSRHRRALMRMLFDFYETDRLMICLDPSNLDLVRDLCEDRSETRMLEIECQYSDTYLAGHARRIGLAGKATPEDALARLLPTIRNDIHRESEALRDLNFPGLHHIRERATPEENSGPLATFLGLDRARALEIARSDHLFAD